MKYVVTAFLLIFGIFQSIIIDTNDTKFFVGEIYYETFKTHSLSSNVIDNSIEKIDHPLLKTNIEKYQIDNELLINNSYSFEDNKIKNLSNIQIGHIQKMYSLTAPDIAKIAEVKELFSKKPEFIRRKQESRELELEATRSEKLILGFQCKKYTFESFNKYTNQEFITEYWIEENLKYDQFKFGNSFAKIFTDKGLILQKTVLLKSSRDTFSNSYAIKISFVDNFNKDSNSLGF